MISDKLCIVKVIEEADTAIDICGHTLAWLIDYLPIISTHTLLTRHDILNILCTRENSKTRNVYNRLMDVM